MKGIILAGGTGSRLFPITYAVSKQMLPVFDKPMIYYPLSVLMLAGIREVLIISTPRDLPVFRQLLGNGDRLGMKFEYAVQDAPRGLADAFIVGERFIGTDRVALVLGDNIFYGQSFSKTLQAAGARERGATIFGYYVKDPCSHGVVEFDSGRQGHIDRGKAKDSEIALRRARPVFLRQRRGRRSQSVAPSARGEIEITSVNNAYLAAGIKTEYGEYLAFIAEGAE